MKKWLGWMLAGGAVLLLLAGGLVWVVGHNDTGTIRANTLKLAADYGSHGDYQRALDLLDQLLIKNASDQQAMALRDKLLADQQTAEQNAKNQQMNALQSANSELRSSLNSLSQKFNTPSSSFGGDSAAQEAAQRRAEAQKAEALRLEREKAQEAHLSAAQRAKQKLIDQGIQLMNNGQYAQAREKFSQVLSQDPSNGEANIRLGENFFLENPGDPNARQKALDALSQGLSAAPRNAHGFAVRGDVYAESKNWPAAISDYQTSLRLDPNNSEVWYSLGKAYFISRRYQEAADAFKTSLRYDEKNPLTYNALGSSYAQLGNDHKAQEAFTRAVELKPGFALAHYQLGRTLANQGKLEAALRSFQKAAQLDPQSVTFAAGLGAAYYDLGRYKDAEAQYARSVVLNGSRADLVYNLSTCQLQLGEINQALDNAQKATSMDATVPEYFFNLGQCLEKVGSPDLAVSAYQTALQLKADYAAPRVQIALILEKKGDLDGAMTQLRRAYDSAPSNAAVVNNLGQVYLKKHLASEAIDFFHKALTHQNDTPDIRYNLALAYIAAGQKDLGLAVLEDLVKLFPHYWDGWYQLGSLQYDLGHNAEGKKTYEKLLTENPSYQHKAEIEAVLAK
ncbi:MAG: tetratricopeptide repeat protein [Spirochaetales bacterium]|nr:tetratricopeptide repeat protein [Spirochaetales bacterium]